MDTEEFEKVLNLADRQAAAARAQMERRAREESAARQMKLVRSRIASLEEKAAEIRSLGEEPLPAVSEALAALRKEEGSLAAEFPGMQVSEPAPRADRPPVSHAEKEDVLQMIDECHDTDLELMGEEERFLVVQTWALRWRIAADRIGQDRAPADKDMRAMYSRIMERVDRWRLPRVRGLSRDDRGAWPAIMSSCVSKLYALRSERDARMEAEGLVEELRRHEVLADDPESARRFQHLVRTAARHEWLRDDIADAVSAKRGHLGPEFDFLWDGEDNGPPPDQGRRMTRREVVERMLRRMLSKAAIGECHVPAEKIHKGFPGHMKGEAKDAAEALARAGVLRYKATNYGFRVSLEPAQVEAARRFVDGGDLGLPEVDRWMTAGGERAGT